MMLVLEAFLISVGCHSFCCHIGMLYGALKSAQIVRSPSRCRANRLAEDDGK